MAPVINLNLYRLYKDVKSHLTKDGIPCNFKYMDPTFVELTDLFSDDKISWTEFYTGIAAYSITLSK